LKSSLSSAFLIASRLAARSSTPYLSRIPASASSTAKLSAVCPPNASKIPSGFSFRIIFLL
jgi:hypothetical protein